MNTPFDNIFISLLDNKSRKSRQNKSLDFPYCPKLSFALLSLYNHLTQYGEL